VPTAVTVVADVVATVGGVRVVELVEVAAWLGVVVATADPR
jgi:hypothetical protein